MRYTFSFGLQENPYAAEIRRHVFIEEQGFKNEFDDIDKKAYHVVIFVNDIPAATGRLFSTKGNTANIGRVAVLRDFRGMSLGSYVIAVLEKKAHDLGFHKIELSAQVRVKNFYIKLGYSPDGEEYTDESCPHIKMVKNIG